MTRLRSTCLAALLMTTAVAIVQDCGEPALASEPRVPAERSWPITANQGRELMTSWSRGWIIRFDADVASAPLCWSMTRRRVDCRMRFRGGSADYCFGIWKLTLIGTAPGKRTFHASWREGTCRRAVTTT